MKHRSQKIEVPTEKPFDNDELGRENTAEKLTTFLKNTDEPIVLSINAEWGQGKTTFIRMWRQMLKNEDFPTLYYSAWENDFNNDALVTIIGEIESEVEEILKESDKKLDHAKKHLDKAKNIGGEILSNSLPFLIKILTSGIIDSDKINSNDIGSLAKNIAREQIKKYQQSKNQVIEFKDTLTSLAEDLNPENDLPLVIFVDELDRCRPSFALEILERIKHLFSTPNVIFVLSIDKKQLIESIKTVYGQNLNSSGYLKRFIDLEFSLPTPDVTKFSRAMIKKMGLAKYVGDTNVNLNRNGGTEVLKIIINLVDYFDCTLREVEKCYSKVVYTYKVSTRDHDLYPLSLSFLILLNIKHDDLYQSFRDGLINTDSLFDTLSQRSKKLNDLVYSDSGIKIWANLTMANNHYNEIDAMITSLENEITDESISESERQFLEKRQKSLNLSGYHVGRKIIRYIFQNIDMVSSFE